MSTAHTTETSVPDETVGNHQNNGYHPGPDLRIWAYPAGVKSLPELLVVLDGMKNSLDMLTVQAEDLLEQATAAVMFAETRIRVNLERDRRRDRRRERRKR